MTTEKVYLRIRGIADLNEIKMIGGELIIKHAGEKISAEIDHLKFGEWPSSVGSIECPHENNRDINACLHWACELLKKNRTIVERVHASGGSFDLYCALGLSKKINSFELSAPLLQCLGEFKASIFFRVIYDEIFGM